MSANIAKTILPGEHGFHTRDGSLTKRKLEQWEKEKAESLQWFPFGASQARTSRRSREPERSRPQTDSSSAVVKESLNTSSEAENISSQIAQAQDVINGNNVNLVAQNQAGHFASLPTSFHASYASVGQISSQPTPMPYQVPLSGDNHNSYAAPFVYNQLANPYIQHFPGLVPIFPSLYPHVTTTAVIDNAHSSSNDVNMVLPQHQPLLISTADQWNYSNQQKQYHMMQNMAGSFYVSSACSNDEDLVDNQHYSHGNNELARSPLPSLPEDRHELVRMNKAELDEQLMEKRRLEEAILEEEKRETEHLKKIHEEQERRQEQESAGEVNKWKKRQEALDANEKAFMEKLEKAKFESEVLRKAKRFKHILLHSETTQEKIGEVLGTNDRELIRRVLNELGALERQKRLEMENLSASHVSATCGGGGGAVGSLNSTVSSRPASTSGVTPSSSQRGVSSDGGLSASLSASQEPKRSILKNGCGAGSKNVASVTGHGGHTEITPLTRGFSMRSSFRPIGSRKYVEVTEALKRRSGSDERLNALTANGKNSTNTYTSNFSPLQQRRDRIESVRSSTSHTSPANAYHQSPSLQKVNSSPKNIINSSCNKLDSNKPVQVPPSSVQQPPRPVPPPRRCLTQQNQQQPLNPTASSSSVNSSHTVVIDDGRDSLQYSQMAGKGLPTVTLDYSSNSRSFASMSGNSNIGRKPAIPPKPANIHLLNKVSVSSRVNGETLTSKNRKNCVSSKEEDSRVNSEELIVELDQYNRQEEISNNHQEASVLCVNTGVQCDAANSLFSIEQHLRHLNRAFTAVANAPPVVMTRRLVGPNVSSAKRYLNELPATLDNNEA